MKPERLKVRHSKNARERWWLYERRRPELYSTIADMDRVLVVALVSRTIMPVAVPTGQTFSHMLGVFASPDPAHAALLSSGVHQAWAIARGSSLKGDLRYTPSDVYETLPQPQATGRMKSAGQALEKMRDVIMMERKVGLTRLYSLFHDASVRDSDIAALRDVHREIDEAVMEAYGWQDLNLSCEFYSTRQGERFTVAPPVRSEILDRLLELNHACHRAESHTPPSVTKASKIAGQGGTGDVLF
ncbi:hypothetical protein ACFUMJ_03680 [Streptomyces olivaceus]|uniref:hypothetical protein n=1 Tax=Streptomyces TaxID=1883 RepID=UPI001FB5BEE0|nr:hypothetical protein [Streptomyces sp. CB09030]UOG77986.1 hypothetical protein L6J92_01585 [Streptomyces sp. CB09030]